MAPPTFLTKVIDDCSNHNHHNNRDGKDQDTSFNCDVFKTAGQRAPSVSASWASASDPHNVEEAEERWDWTTCKGQPC